MLGCPMILAVRYSAPATNKLLRANTSEPVLYSHVRGLKQNRKALAAAAPRLYAPVDPHVHSSIVRHMSTEVTAPSTPDKAFVTHATVPGVLKAQSIGGRTEGTGSAPLRTTRLKV